MLYFNEYFILCNKKYDNIEEKIHNIALLFIDL